MVDAGIAGVLLFTSVVTPPKLERLAALNARAEGLLVAADDAGAVDGLADAGAPLGPAAAGARRRRGRRRAHGRGRSRRARWRWPSGSRRPTGWSTRACRATTGTTRRRSTSRERARRRGRDDGDAARLRRRARRRRPARRGSSPAAAPARTTSTTSSALLTEVQVGTYVFLDGNYADAVLRRDDPHPFTPSLTVRATVVSNAQPGFVITDAGRQGAGGHGRRPSRRGSLTRRAGRVGLPHRGRRHGPHRPATAERPRRRSVTPSRCCRRTATSRSSCTPGSTACAATCWSTSGRSTRGSARSGGALPGLQQRRGLEPRLLGRGALPRAAPAAPRRAPPPARSPSRCVGEQLVQLGLAGVQPAELALQPVGVLARLPQQRCRGPVRSSARRAGAAAATAASCSARRCSTYCSMPPGRCAMRPSPGRP